jgi:hypothetical protein
MTSLQCDHGPTVHVTCEPGVARLLKQMEVVPEKQDPHLIYAVLLYYFSFQVNSGLT